MGEQRQSRLQRAWASVGIADAVDDQLRGRQQQSGIMKIRDDLQSEKSLIIQILAKGRVSPGGGDEKQYRDRRCLAAKWQDAVSPACDGIFGGPELDGLVVYARRLLGTHKSGKKMGSFHLKFNGGRNDLQTGLDARQEIFLKKARVSKTLRFWDGGRLGVDLLQCGIVLEMRLRVSHG